MLLLAAIALPACGVGNDGTLTPTVAPGYPATLKATPGNRSVTLTWTASASGSTYSVWRSLSPAGPFLPITDPAAFLGETAYVDRGLNNGTAIYYVVKARNSFGESGPSEVAGATPGFKATSITAGGSTASAVLTDGTPWTWGQTWLNQGQDSDVPDPTDVPVQVPLLRGVSTVSSSQFCSVALLGDGTVFTWGLNLSITPTAVPHLTEVIAVAAGGYTSEIASPDGSMVRIVLLPFALALRSDGTVWVWGDNSKGQFGNGAVSAISAPLTTEPAQVPGLPKISAIAAGANFCLALAEDGTLWAWGNNAAGQSGIGTASPATTSTPKHIPNFNGVTAISAGTDFCLAMRNDGSVWSWGANASGQLGNGSAGGVLGTAPGPVLLPAGVAATGISAGSTHALAIDGNGSVWGWGENSTGALGDGTTTPAVRPVQALNLSGAVAVAAGQKFSMALLLDGAVCAWGDNSFGQAGVGTGKIHTTPVQVNNLSEVSMPVAGDTFSAAIRTDGAVWTWGGNASAELGTGAASAMPRVLPAKVAAPSAITQLSANGRSILALKSDGTIWGWGDNTFAQFGNGTANAGGGPVQNSTLSGMIGVSCGLTCLAVKNDGSVWGWGYNYFGQTGNGVPGPSTLVTKPFRNTTLSSVSAVASGETFSLALTTLGTVWAWGDNGSGQMGIGSNTPGPFTTPLQVPDLTDVVAIAASYGTAFALKSDGTVWAWGYDWGMLGIGPPGNVPSRSPFRIPGLSGIQSIAAGGDFALAADVDGKVWSWGSGNMNGQLGNGTTSQKNVATPVARVKGVEHVTRVAAGNGFALALRNDGQVFGWGDNSSDQLGVAYVSRYLTPVVIVR